MLMKFRVVQSPRARDLAAWTPPFFRRLSQPFRMPSHCTFTLLCQIVAEWRKAAALCPRDSGGRQRLGLGPSAGLGNAVAEFFLHPEGARGLEPAARQVVVQHDLGL